MTSDKPYVQTYTIVAGSLACNARCPYCIAKMTPAQGMEKKLPEVNWRNFEIGTALAKAWDAITVLITSKGEATLYPEQLTEFMQHLKQYRFMIELQTNGIKLMEDSFDKHLLDWYNLGLTTIAVSIAHYDSNRNKSIYQPHNDNILDLTALIDKLHGKGFSVRLSCTMLNDYIGSIEELCNLIDFAKENKVEQLTATPVRKPAKSENEEVAKYVEEHRVPEKTISDMKQFFDTNGTRLRELAHGAIIYTYKRQNICLSDCLTMNPKDNAIRQLIFFPDGHVRYDWQHEGAIFF